MRPKPGPIAIDFGSYALRVMQLAGRRQLPDGSGRTRVLAASCEVYPPRERGDRPDRSAVVDALRAALRGRKFVGKSVVSALGMEDLRVKNLRLPEMPEAELASAVRFEALERLAGLDEEAEIRFIPAGVVQSEAESQQEVIVLAAPGQVVREHIELLTELGLESAGIDASPCALFRPFERYLSRAEDRNQANLFVDVGYSGMRIIVTLGSRIVFAKSFEVGGAAFDQWVAGRLCVDVAEARQLRRQVSVARAEGGDRPGGVNPATAEAVDAAVRTRWEQLGKEIGLCLRYYAVTFRGPRPDTVTCIGGESLDARHLEHLSAVTGLRCRVGYPLRSMTCVDALPPLPEGRGADCSMADWTTAVGLAMKPAATRHHQAGLPVPARVVEKVA